MCFKLLKIDKIFSGSVRFSTGIFVGHKEGCEAVSADIRAHSGKGVRSPGGRGIDQR